MDSVIKNILGLSEHDEGEENEDQSKKLQQEVVVYLNPDQIGDKAGAHCGACLFFNAERSECLLTTPPACNAEHGVCAAFLGGPSIFQAKGHPLEKLPKAQAGYTEDAPTRCSICEYWKGKTKDDPDADPDEKGSCEKVEGAIQAGGCCNRWEEC